MNRLLGALSSAWYEFLYQYTGNDEYARVSQFQAKREPGHSLDHLGFTHVNGIWIQRVSIHCTSPPFQRFLVGHAKTCMDMLRQDPFVDINRLPTYEEAIENACKRAVGWTLRMMPHSQPVPDINGLRDAVVRKVLPNRQ